jgi:2-oxoglutarate dehydrogenase E2 component (dihydrolipoamide succinyltransferase)
MFSRRLATAARVVSLRRPLQPMRGMPLPALMNQVRTYADTVVKVPQMAESISEGTLKQWNKQVGDYVEQDEEIATIETDKVRNRTAAVAESEEKFGKRSRIDNPRFTRRNNKLSW